MPDEFETVAMSKFGKMPVVLLLDKRHRNITDFQFESVKRYIRNLVDGEEKSKSDKKLDESIKEMDEFIKMVRPHIIWSAWETIRYKLKGVTP